MEPIRIQQIVDKDGEVIIKGLPYKKGQSIEIVLISQSPDIQERPYMTVGQFRKLGLIGLWKDREDIQDSSAYARQLREQAQRQRRVDIVHV